MDYPTIVVTEQFERMAVLYAHLYIATFIAAFVVFLAGGLICAIAETGKACQSKKWQRMGKISKVAYRFAIAYLIAWLINVIILAIANFLS